VKLLLYGSTQFSTTVRELARHCGFEVAGVIDQHSSGNKILGSFEEVTLSHPPGDYAMALAVGYRDLAARWQAWERIRAAGYATPALIHPNSYVADSATVGAGAMIMAGALVDVHARIGEAAVIWPGACINHDTHIGANSFMSPGSIVCGCSSIGSNTFVGAGAVVVDHVSIPDNSFLQAAGLYKSQS
jgi:sugar O-acyltransferase (sialic acid O-acetyltransferase NeuD family)